MAEDADVIVVGGGLAGLVAATEIADAGKRVIVVDQEGEQSLGGQAFWSFGGLFLVDSPEQRRLTFKFRHRVDTLIITNGTVEGVSGSILEPTAVERGQSSSRTVTGDFTLRAQAVIVASGGIGGNHDLVRQNWPKRLGEPPKFMISGVPEHVDGRMIGITEAAGARLINRDRMWHYVEGIRNWNPIWPRHGIRILPGPSSMWFDATGKRLPAPLFPGSDTLGQLEYIMGTGYDYSWFILTQSIIKKEFALSGSEQNPDLTGKSWRMTIKRATNKGAPAPVEAFKKNGADFIVRDNLADLVSAMNALSGDNLLQLNHIKTQIEARDREITNPYVKDAQVMNMHNARRYIGDKLIRTAKPHRILDAEHGPLIAVKLNILTRKTLGGFEPDLDSRVFGTSDEIIRGLYAAGEAAGFGGGGVHGYRSLEGTFLGGCLFC